ncbi:hypothetical protein A9G45_02680 [Gilliamella sp. HK2]|uniref:hypothetical protein n=1 Tax=unclassified Gilliamella TaxID=2685620 RepID=UPI00080EC312|nr:hypothetical protein [Gilliamella apicola]OCG24181.1 hypothetical protein A9G46_08930 [Gilliamella apicola]OCG30608.1 hypothetical protein A9G45_02680 [Gilliamella apicola]
MGSFYERSSNTALRLLSKYGIEYSVLRKGKVSIVNGKEVITGNQTFTAIGVKTNYNQIEIDGTVIQSGDIQMIFAANIELKINDIVTVDDEKYLIKQPNPVKPADVLICYKAQLRKA